MDRFGRLICLAFVITLLGTSTPAFADGMNLSFTDNHIYWRQGQSNDWHNNSNSYGYVDDSMDYIGTPNILGGTVGINDRKMVSLTVNYTNGSSIEKAGDLFIDKDSDNYWDYVVKIYDAAGHDAGAEGTYGLYSAHIDSRKNDNPIESSNSYYLSGHDNSGIWSGYVIRDDSPYAAEEDALGGMIGQVSFSGWQTTWGPNSTTFTFGADNSIFPDLGGSELFTIAWGPNCANDVLWEQIAMPASATPEPSTMILLGSGMLLLGFKGRLQNRPKARV